MIGRAPLADAADRAASAFRATSASVEQNRPIAAELRERRITHAENDGRRCIVCDLATEGARNAANVDVAGYVARICVGCARAIVRSAGGAH